MVSAPDATASSKAEFTSGAPGFSIAIDPVPPRLVIMSITA